jgi:hypothetical protein
MAARRSSLKLFVESLLDELSPSSSPNNQESFYADHKHQETHLPLPQLPEREDLVPRLSFGGTEGIVDDSDEQERVRINRKKKDTTDEGKKEACEAKKEGSITTIQRPPLHAFLRQKKANTDSFVPGDHVYRWNKLIQHHGIVLHVDADGTVLLVDFAETHNASHPILTFRFKRLQPPIDDWHKVEYGVNRVQRAVSLPGTCTCHVPDSSKTILDRVNFLMLHPDLIPPYHQVSSNCETIAFWCTTGHWRALQVGHQMSAAASGTLVGSGTVATYAAAEGVGLLLGAESVGLALLGAEVALVAPLVLPALAVTSIAVGGASVYKAHQERQEWKDITARLNEEFDRHQMLEEQGLSQTSLGRLDGEVSYVEMLLAQPFETMQC